MATLGNPATRQCVAAAVSQPPLQALLAIQAVDDDRLDEALRRCSPPERAQVLRIALGHAGSGFTIGRRVAAAAAVSRSWWAQLQFND